MALRFYLLTPYHNFSQRDEMQSDEASHLTEIELEQTPDQIW